MKALFSTFPAYGHLLPMLPLARAAAASGDEVVVVAGRELHGTDDGLTMRDLEPPLAEILAENGRRSGQDVLGYRSDASALLDETVALFTTTRADLSFDELCDVAASERPDVIVAEMWDYLAPMVARKLDIPWVAFAHSPATAIDTVLEGGMRRAMEQRGLSLPERLATVQMWPEWLETEPRTGDGAGVVLPIAAVPYDTPSAVQIPGFRGDRPVVLVTLGTVVQDPELLEAAVRGVLDAGADALVTTGFTTRPEDVAGDADRVRAVSFAPIGQLLGRVQAVVAAGGSGSTIAALSHGLPLAFVPRIANQPQVAAAVAEFGAGIVCDDETKPADAVRSLLEDQRGLRDRARAAAELLEQRAAPETVWSTLHERVDRRSHR